MTDTRELLERAAPMTPTREDFQDVAEWMGVTTPLLFNYKGVPSIDSINPWQPHLLGTDMVALMAALCHLDIAWSQNMVSVVVDTGSSLREAHTSHTNTPESKAAALASAVFQCAVKVAREAKR